MKFPFPLPFLPAATVSLVLLSTGFAQLANRFDYRIATVVVYNAADPESKTLAEYYATKRGVPATNLLGLQTSQEETITRTEFQKTIESPLRAAFIERGWWKTGTVPQQGNIAIQTSIRVLTLIRGLPLRVSEEAVPGVASPANGDSNASSVDSELAICGLLDKPIKGPLQNPYYGRAEPFYTLPITPMFLVGRIDGPDKASARRLIDDAIATEATGLYGKAYIDLALKNEPGYKVGEDWLLAAARSLELKGIPVMVDSLTSTLPVNFPMSDAAYYLGWYVQSADGPFLNPNFKFRRGAVACHIHSFSATTVRSTRDYWCGPLLAKGACAVLGNAWEPFLQHTTQLDKFTESLLAGRNLGEAAWGATQTLSWMNVVLGDPLYQPFPANPAKVEKDIDTDYKALRLALARWGKAGPANEALMKYLKLAGTTLQSDPSSNVWRCMPRPAPILLNWKPTNGLSWLCKTTAGSRTESVSSSNKPTPAAARAPTNLRSSSSKKSSPTTPPPRKPKLPARGCSNSVLPREVVARRRPLSGFPDGTLSGHGCHPG